MATTISGPVRLRWESQGPYQIADDGRCLYVRESTASIIGGMAFSTALAIGGVGAGVWFFTQPGRLAKAGGVLFLLVASAFAYVIVSSTRRGRYLVVFDRGVSGGEASGTLTPDAPPSTLDAPRAPEGGVRCGREWVPAERIRALSIRSGIRSGGMERRYIVAELTDGREAVVGLAGVSTWPAYYAQRAAAWMGVPYRPESG